MSNAPRTIVITGASDGIGAAAARRLHDAGHTVVIVGRDAAKTARVAGELGVEHHVADFARLDDVRRLAADLVVAHPRIDVLANNAGALYDSFARTADGFERTFQVDHLAPYLLTRLLVGNVLAAEGIVLWTSSAVVRTLRTIDVEDLERGDAPGRYRPLRVYAHAKVASLLVMAELHRRYGGQGLATAAFHPGVVATGFSTTGDGVVGRFYRSGLSRLLLASPERGAQTLVELAEGRPGADWQPGAYLERGRTARRQPAVLADPALSHAVWERTEELLAAHVD